MVCLEQHRRQGDPATRGRLTEGHLFLQWRGQQEVLLNVHEHDLLLVSAAGLVTVIIGLAASLILIVIGSFFKEKIQL
jgi:hypothetical protein